MNRYGKLAMRTWQQGAPRRVAAIEDPTQFFTQLGEQVADQVEQIVLALEADLDPGLAYLDRVGQMNAIRAQAEEVALADLVYGPLAQDPAWGDLRSRLEDLLGQAPTRSMLEDKIARIHLEAELDADRQGWTAPVLDPDQQDQIQECDRLIPLVDVDPEQLSPAELRTAIAALTRCLQHQA